MSPTQAEWYKYFESIQDVCPWSFKAYKNNMINFYEGDLHIRNLDESEANIYIFTEGYSDDDLYEIAEELNNTYAGYEFLWSHPDYTKGGHRQTPVPVIIQQDRKTLEILRDKQKTS